MIINSRPVLFFLCAMKKIIGGAGFDTWFRFAIFNLLLVAFLGIILRYKIAFSLPLINQKFLLHAHSHFAFAGWISQALMVFIAVYINKHSRQVSQKKYHYLLLANLITAYGMLLSFPFTGYAVVSIIFSTLSIFTSYAFAIIAWRDLNKIPVKKTAHRWFKASLVFNAVSSLGAFSLAYMMANKIAHPNWYLAAIYFFLHFQYNGWFLFACIGLLAAKLKAQFISEKLQRVIFYLFAFACVPTYFLSALWLPLPTWVYTVVVIAALLQLAAGFLLLNKILSYHKSIFENIPLPIKYIWCLSAVALSMKLLLQACSTIPALSTWAYGFRPIVIGYLHLILLGMISLFLIGYGMYERHISFSRNTSRGTWIFVAGIVLNESVLLVQGLGAISYAAIPYVNELLFLAAAIMFTGIFILNAAGKTTHQEAFEQKILASPD